MNLKKDGIGITMDISKFLRLKGSAPSLVDEAAYELIALELSNSAVKQGLWTKALADGEWDELKAKSMYVKMRHAQLLDEFENIKEPNEVDQSVNGSTSEKSGTENNLSEAKTSSESTRFRALPMTSHLPPPHIKLTIFDHWNHFNALGKLCLVGVILIILYGLLGGNMDPGI